MHLKGPTLSSEAQAPMRQQWLSCSTFSTSPQRPRGPGIVSPGHQGHFGGGKTLKVIRVLLRGREPALSRLVNSSARSITGVIFLICSGPRPGNAMPRPLRAFLPKLWDPVRWGFITKHARFPGQPSLLLTGGIGPVPAPSWLPLPLNGDNPTRIVRLRRAR